MGWQSRLPKDQKPEFKRTCNKCGDTGIKKTFVSIAGVPQTTLVQCKCILKAEEEAKIAAERHEIDGKLVEGLAKEEKELSK